MKFSRQQAFTLVELLTVIAIIAVLMGLLFPAIGAAKESARKVQAKNDSIQIVTAVKAFYTEYGTYPTEETTDEVEISDDTKQAVLFDVLRVESATNANVTKFNPRQIVFMEAPIAKDQSAPKSGLKTNGGFYDPWGSPYKIRIDGNYDNKVKGPYSTTSIGTGVIVWSLGKDKKQDSSLTNGDDVVSWQ